MLIEAIIVIGGIMISAVLWPYIRDLCSKTLIPSLRKLTGKTVANAVAQLVVWVDNPVSTFRRSAKSLLNTFKRHVLGISTKFRWKNANQVEAETKTHIATESGDVHEVTTVQVISADELPTKVRAAMIQRGQREAELDVRQAFVNQADKQLQL